jgi:hypothetical protein
VGLCCRGDLEKAVAEVKQDLVNCVEHDRKYAVTDDSTYGQVESRDKVGRDESENW